MDQSLSVLLIAALTNPVEESAKRTFAKNLRPKVRVGFWRRLLIIRRGRIHLPGSPTPPWLLRLPLRPWTPPRRRIIGLIVTWSALGSRLRQVSQLFLDFLQPLFCAL